MVPWDGRRGKNTLHLDHAFVISRCRVLDIGVAAVKSQRCVPGHGGFDSQPLPGTTVRLCRMVTSQSLMQDFVSDRPIGFCIWIGGSFAEYRESPMLTVEGLSPVPCRNRQAKATL